MRNLFSPLKVSILRLKRCTRLPASLGCDIYKSHVRAINCATFIHTQNASDISFLLSMQNLNRDPPSKSCFRFLMSIFFQSPEGRPLIILRTTSVR